MLSAMYSASAWMVAVGFTPADGGGMQKVMVVFTKPYPGKGSNYVVWDPAAESILTAFPLAGSRSSDGPLPRNRRPVAWLDA